MEKAEVRGHIGGIHENNEKKAPQRPMSVSYAAKSSYPHGYFFHVKERQTEQN